jgi:hypothetical protein
MYLKYAFKVKYYINKSVGKLPSNVFPALILLGLYFSVYVFLILIFSLDKNLYGTCPPILSYSIIFPVTKYLL